MAVITKKSNMKEGLKTIVIIIAAIIVIGIVGGIVTGALNSLQRLLDSIPWWLWLAVVIAFFYVLSKQK